MTRIEASGKRIARSPARPNAGLRRGPVFKADRLRLRNMLNQYKPCDLLGSAERIEPRFTVKRANLGIAG